MRACFAKMSYLPLCSGNLFNGNYWSKIVSEYDQEISQSQTAYNPMAPLEIINRVKDIPIKAAECNLRNQN